MDSYASPITTAPQRPEAILSLVSEGDSRLVLRDHHEIQFDMYHTTVLSNMKLEIAAGVFRYVPDWSIEEHVP